MNCIFFFWWNDAKLRLTLRHSDDKTAKFRTHLLNHITIVTLPNVYISLWTHICQLFNLFCIRLKAFLNILNRTPYWLHSFLSRWAEFTKRGSNDCFYYFCVLDECFFLLFSNFLWLKMASDKSIICMRVLYERECIGWVLHQTSSSATFAAILQEILDGKKTLA